MKSLHTHTQKKVLSGERHVDASVLGPELLCLSSQYAGFFILVHGCPKATHFSLNFHLREIKRVFFSELQNKSFRDFCSEFAQLAARTFDSSIMLDTLFFPPPLGDWAFCVSHPPLMLYFSLKITVIITPLFSDRG